MYTFRTLDAALTHVAQTGESVIISPALAKEYLDTFNGQLDAQTHQLMHEIIDDEVCCHDEGKCDDRKHSYLCEGTYCFTNVQDGDVESESEVDEFVESWAFWQIWRRS